MIHMNNQALFSSKDKSKELRCRLLQFFFGALRVGLNNILFKYNLYIHINDTSNTGFDSKHNAYI